MESRAEDRAVEISLQPYQGSQHDGPGAQGAEAAFQSLKPVDTGRDAWTVLVAGIAFEALFWGKFLLGLTSEVHLLSRT